MEVLSKCSVSKDNLKKRKIVLDDNCDHCSSFPETVLHALWECPKVSTMWDSISDFDFHHTHNFPTISNIILYAQKEGKNQETLVMLRTIWFCKN